MRQKIVSKINQNTCLKKTYPNFIKNLKQKVSANRQNTAWAQVYIYQNKSLMLTKDTFLQKVRLTELARLVSPYRKLRKLKTKMQEFCCKVYPFKRSGTTERSCHYHIQVNLFSKVLLLCGNFTCVVNTTSKET